MSYTIFNGLWVTEHRNTGKMGGMDSIALSHPVFCHDRHTGVCGHCYSKRLSGYRPLMVCKQKNNSMVLESSKFKPCKINTINGVLRWSSFGELDNIIQLKNICKMANENKHILHVIWTKRHDLVRKLRKKPNNLKIIWSATKIDISKPFIPKGYDSAFFVYTKHIPENIHHCTGKCSECMFCYSKQNGIIGEILK